MNRKALSHGQIAEICLELSLFLHAGADCAGALTLLAEETADAPLRALLQDMVRQMDAGAPLSQVAAESGVFPESLCAMLRVGEATGRSEEALRALAQYHDQRSQMDRQLRAALLYPSLLLMVMLAVIGLLLTQVLPIFNEVYASLGASLTGLGGGLLELGRWLKSILPVLGVVFALLVLGLILFSTMQSFRDKCLALWQKRRGNRGLSGKLSAARFAQALSMALSSGLGLEEAIRTAGELLAGQDGSARQLENCLQQIAQGGEALTALKEQGLLPAAECRLLQLGFTSGSVESTMEEIARRLDWEAENALQEALDRVEPAMVLVTSLLVGAILLSVMLPLARIMTAMG